MTSPGVCLKLGKKCFYFKANGAYLTISNYLRTSMQPPQCPQCHSEREALPVELYLTPPQRNHPTTMLLIRQPNQRATNSRGLTSLCYYRQNLFNFKQHHGQHSLSPALCCQGVVQYRVIGQRKLTPSNHMSTTLDTELSNPSDTLLALPCPNLLHRSSRI